MKRSKVLETLIRIKTELTRRFGVVGLKTFGSTARDKAGTDSNVDIVVTFDGPSTSHRYFGAQFQVEDALGCPVDLVAEKALRPELRKCIEREAVSV
ncbi:MAG: nucleotidyltransferase family protein [Nitrospirales bacterium]